MSEDCEPAESIRAILTVVRFSPLPVLPIFLFAAYILIFKSSKHLQPCKRAYGYFIANKFVCMLFLSAGVAPILHTPAWGFQTTGFLQIFSFLNPMWPVIISIYSQLIMVYFLVQVINTRCSAVQSFSVAAYREEKKMFVMIRFILRMLYFFILFSFWCLLLLLGFGENDDQKRLREAAMKNKAKDVDCRDFFFLDTQSWRLYLSIAAILFLLITLLIYSSGVLSGAYHILKESRMTVSKKVYKIQTGFLVLIAIQLGVLFVFLVFLPCVFMAIKSPGSEPTLLTILLFIAHHGTFSSVVFIFAHRFVRSRITEVYNNCAPKQCRVGVEVDADRLDMHSVPQIQVFAVITDNTTV